SARSGWSSASWVACFSVSEASRRVSVRVSCATMLKLCVLLGVATLSNVAFAIPVTWEAHDVVREVALGEGASDSTAESLVDLGVEVGAPFTVRVHFDSDATLYTTAFDPSSAYAIQIPDMRVDFANWSLNRAIGPISGYGAIQVNLATDPS